MPTIKRRSTKRKTSTKKSGMSARNKLILKALLGVGGAGALGYGGYRAYKSFGSKIPIAPPQPKYIDWSKVNKYSPLNLKTRAWSVPYDPEAAKKAKEAKTGGKRRSIRRMMW
jgi:hypothetical protein